MIATGQPFQGQELARLKTFLQKMELDYDAGIQHSICLYNDDTEIIATASLEENVLKCISVSQGHPEERLIPLLLNQLIALAFAGADTHLFLYTKPKNRTMFEGLTFHPILQTDKRLLMENRRTGLSDYLEGLLDETPPQALRPETRVGGLALNGSHLSPVCQKSVEEALERCDFLHIFLAQNRYSAGAEEQQFRQLEKKTGHLEGIILHRPSDYILSTATYPGHSNLNEKSDQTQDFALDVELFGQFIAPTLNITTRFIMGAEQSSPMNHYHQTISSRLPQYGIQVVTLGGQRETRPISASTVRKLWQVARALA